MLWHLVLHCQCDMNLCLLVQLEIDNFHFFLSVEKPKPKSIVIIKIIIQPTRVQSIQILDAVTQIGNMKPQFPGILHSSRFHPILEVNNRPQSNPGYLILILSTSLFNTEVIYNALLSTKELHLSMKTDCTKFWDLNKFDSSS